MARNKHINLGFALLAALILSSFVSLPAAQAQPIHAGMGDVPCGQDRFSFAYGHPGLPGCGRSYREADPYLRYGTELTATDPNGGHFDYERAEAARSLPKPTRDPNQIATIMVEIYGSRSVLSRSARSVAELTSAAKVRSKEALTGLNSATNWVVGEARRVFHANDLPEFRFQSKVNRHYLGLRIQARW